MTIKQLEELLQESAKDTTEEFKRLFHGRGGLYDEWKHLTIDSVDTVAK